MYNNTLDDEALNSHSFIGGVAVCTKGTVIQDNSHAGDQSIAAKKPSHKDRKNVDIVPASACVLASLESFQVS
jgi:hypothetical protein